MSGKVYFGISTRLVKKIKDNTPLVNILFSLLIQQLFLSADFIKQAALQGTRKD